MAMKSAFCCTTLKKGSIIVGWINLAYTLCALLMQSLELAEALGWLHGYSSNAGLPSHLRKSELSSDEQSQKLLIRAVYCGTSVLNVGYMVSLLYGSYKGLLWYLLPYLFFFGMVDGIFALYITEWSMAMLREISMTQVLVAVVAIPIHIYLYCVVWFYFMTLWSERKKSIEEVKEKKEVTSSV